MKICIFGTAWFDDYYSRNSGIHEALTQTGHEVSMCAFAGIYRGRRLRKLFWVLETPIRWILLLTGFNRIRRADILYLPYPAFIDVLPALLLKRILGVKIYYDVFIGLYDSIVRDRQLTTSPAPGKLIYAYERFILKSVDRCFIDTVFHKDMLVSDYRLAEDRVMVIANPIAEDIWSSPARSADKSGVIFWGTYIPLHGIDTIIAAARILQDRNSPIRLELGNIDFITRFIPMPELKALADESLCVLGIFSTGRKADRVIPYKVAQALCAAMPVITASTTASRDLAGDTGALYLVPPGDPEALAGAILDVCANEATRNTLSLAGRSIYESRLSRKAIASQVIRAFA
jgi:glycosyltransferase involved in cell wall biosynthesis